MKALFPGGRCLEFRGWSWGGGLLLFFLALFLPGAALKAAPLEVSPYSSWPGGTVQTLKLSSGVQATIQRVPSAWAAAVNLSLEAGSQYDPPGQWGTAHLVEHLLFRRTPAFPAGKLGLSLEKIGAQSGASTTPQKMEFWEIVPAQSLDLALEISASRLSGLLLGKGDLERERQQVAAELRRLHTNPWRLLQSHFLGALYPQATPSKLHPEGSWEEMRSLTPSQLLDFYQRYCQPQRARLQLLWLVEELGEVVSIVKKRKVEGIMEDPAVRARFLEEMSDVLMYFTDVLLCLGVTAEEFSAAYEAKHQRNMRRDFVGEHQHYLQEERNG